MNIETLKKLAEIRQQILYLIPYLHEDTIEEMLKPIEKILIEYGVDISDGGRYGR